MAERLYAEVCSDDALYLLATCYYRAGKTTTAYSVLKNKGCRSSQCRFLYAKCCFDLKKFSEAEFAIAGNCIAKMKSLDDIVNEFGDSGSFAVQLLGEICLKTSRETKSSEAFRKSLKLNPFLWSSYEFLVNLGEKPDPTKIFNICTIEHFSLSQGTNPLVNLVNKTLVPNIINSTKESATNGSEVQDTSQLSGKITILPLSPVPAYCQMPDAFIRSTPEPDDIEVYSCESNSWVSYSSLNKTSKKTPKNNRNLFGIQNNTLSPLTPCFGILPITTPGGFQDHDTQNLDRSNPKKQLMTRRCQDMNPPKFQIFSQSGNNSNANLSMNQTPQTSLTSVNTGNVRRSSRLLSSSNSVKENNKSRRTYRFISTKVPTKKTKVRTKAAITEPKECELNEINRPDIQSENKTDYENKSSSNSVSVAQEALSMQKASVEGLMWLLQELGKAQLFLSQCSYKKAIEILNGLPVQHYNTGWVLTTLGKAHFELAEYEQAVEVFEKVRRTEPHRPQILECFITTLWSLKRKSRLLLLCNDLLGFDKSSPESWYATGCWFSLENEHGTSIRLLCQAIRVNPDFKEARTILGYEYMITGQVIKAMCSFKDAIQIDPRHYNAWYGISLLYSKERKFSLSNRLYKKALRLHPQGCFLLQHIGMIHKKLGRDMEPREENQTKGPIDKHSNEEETATNEQVIATENSSNLGTGIQRSSVPHISLADLEAICKNVQATSRTLLRTTRAAVEFRDIAHAILEAFGIFHAGLLQLAAGKEKAHHASTQMNAVFTSLHNQKKKEAEQ